MKELAKCKLYHKDFKPDLLSPVRSVPHVALMYPEKERLVKISKPKQLHKDFEPDLPVLRQVSTAAKEMKPTKR